MQEQEQMTIFQDFVRWYNNKNVVPTLEAMQKMMEIYHNRGIDMLKLGCTLPNLANICLDKSTNNKFYPFVEVRICQEMPTGLSTRLEFDSDTQKFKAGQNKSSKFEKIVMS